MLRENFIKFDKDGIFYNVYYNKKQNGKGRQWRVSKYSVKTKKLTLIHINFTLATKIKVSIMTQGVDNTISLVKELFKTRKVLREAIIDESENQEP